MNFKIGILIDCFRLPFEDALKRAAEMEVDGIQMYVTFHQMSLFNPDACSGRVLKKKIDNHALEIAALCGDLGGHGFEIKEENRSKIAETKKIIDFAHELETAVVTTHIGVIPGDKNEKYYAMQEVLQNICRHAEKMGVFLAVETGPEKSLRLKSFIEEAGQKNLKVNLDPANLVMVQGENPAQAVINLKDYIVHTHAKDGRMVGKCDPVQIYNAFAEGNPGNINFDDYFVELPLGEGNVNFPEYLKALESIGYSGYITIERENGEDRVGDIKAGVDFLKYFQDR